MKRTDFFRGMWLSPLALVRGPEVPPNSSRTVDSQRDVVLVEQLATTQGVFNVTSFGATGDGTTDDTAAFQSAVDVAGAAGGGTIIVPPGEYMVSGLVVDWKNVIFQGAMSGYGYDSAGTAVLLNGNIGAGILSSTSGTPMGVGQVNSQDSKAFLLAAPRGTSTESSPPVG